jgi:predicted dehydrogenase
MGISLGIVGLGAFGSGFVRPFKFHPLVDRLALCDRETERVRRFVDDPLLRDKFDPADVYATLEEICAAEIDALAIITQPWLHAEQAIQALQAGKHVYSAVPIVTVPDGSETLDWCDKLVAAVEHSGKRFMLGETTFFKPEAMYCRRQHAAGGFGTIVFAEGEYYHDVDSPGCNLRDVRAHRLKSAAGREWAARGHSDLTAPMHYPTHSVSGPISVLGEPFTKVSAFGFMPPAPDEYFDDTFSNETALFHTASGASIRINEYRQIGCNSAETFRIFGTQGVYRDRCWEDKSTRTPLAVDEMRDPLPDEVFAAFRELAFAAQALDEGADPGFYRDQDFEPQELAEKVYGGHGGSHAFLVHEFVEAVHQDRHPAINAWEAARYMAAGVMAHKSALQGGELLEVPDWGRAPA